MNVKICKTCKEIKHILMFYKNNKSSDGYASSCKKCHGEYYSKKRKDIEYKIKMKAYKHEYYLKNKDKLSYKEKHNKNARKYAKKNHLKTYARDVVRNDIRHGRTNKKPCEVCGILKVHAHHDNYDRPRDVRWLCISHHVEVHHGSI